MYFSLVPSFSLRRCGSRKKVMAATVGLGHLRPSLRAVPYCAKCSTNHRQTSKRLPIWTNTHFEPLGTLSASQAKEYHNTCLFYLLPDADYGNLAEKKLFRLSVQINEGIIWHGGLLCIQKMVSLLRSKLANFYVSGGFVWFCFSTYTQLTKPARTNKTS